MPAQQIPSWARELGVTPEGLQAFRRRRRFGGQRPMLPGGAGPQPSPMPGTNPRIPPPIGGGPAGGGPLGGPAAGGGVPGSTGAPILPQRLSDSQIQGGIDSGSMSVTDAVKALDARKVGAPAPPIKPPVAGDPTQTPPIVDPDMLEKPAQQGGPITQTPPIFVPPTDGTKPPVITGAPTLPPVLPKPDDGTITPPIYPGPTGPPGVPPGGGAAGGGAGGPNLPPPAQRMAAFDFSPYAGQENYHTSAGFQQEWEDTFAALNGLDPETRARAEASYQELAGAGIRPGEGRGINAWRTAINRAQGFEDEPMTPTGTNPPPPDLGTSADTGGIFAYGQGGSMSGTNPRTVPPLSGGMRSDAEALAAAAGGMAPNPMLSPPPEAMAAALGEAGMRRGGRPRPGTKPRPTLPNESGQAKPRYPRLAAREARRGRQGPSATVADESGQVPPRRRPQGPRNPRAGGY